MRPPTIAKACCKPMTRASNIGICSSFSRRERQAENYEHEGHREQVDQAFSGNGSWNTEGFPLTFFVKVNLGFILWRATWDVGNTHGPIVVSIALPDEGCFQAHDGGNRNTPPQFTKNWQKLWTVLLRPVWAPRKRFCQYTTGLIFAQVQSFIELRKTYSELQLLPKVCGAPITFF